MWYIQGTYNCIDLESSVRKYDTQEDDQHLVDVSVIGLSEEHCLELIKIHIIDNVFGCFVKSRLMINKSECLKPQVLMHEESSF